MPNEKRPLEGRRVEDTVTDDPHEIRRLRELGYGLGLLLSENNLSVADFDDKDAGRVFWRDHYKEGIIQAASETRRGAHLIFSGRTKTRKFEHGDIKGNGHIVIPDTVIDGWRYRWILELRTLDLAPFPEHLFPVPQKKEVKPEECNDSFRRIIRARAYGVRVVCIEHRSAHNTLFRFVSWMRDHGLSQTEAFAVLLDWNRTNCFRQDGTTPYPWTESEIRHKIEDSYAQVTQ
jgi:hypothetical protein